MIKRSLIIVMTAIMMLSAVGCFSQTFVVGNGAKGNQTEDARQWYILWGLVPLNTVDSKAMAGDTKNYTVNTEFTFVDWVISIFTGFVTVYPKTVTVTK